MMKTTRSRGTSEVTERTEMYRRKYQTKEENRAIKQQGEILTHISNAVIIGLSNIFNIEMEIKVPTLKDDKKPKTLHNLIVERASICRDFAQPSLGTTRSEKKDRENKIYNQLSSHLEKSIREIVAEMNGNCDWLRFEKTDNRPSVIEKLHRFKTFEPFNDEGMKEFGIQIIEIVTQRLPKTHTDKKHALVRLEGCNDDITNAFYQVLGAGGYTTSTAQILLDHFSKECKISYEVNESNKENYASQTTYQQEQSETKQVDVGNQQIDQQYQVNSLDYVNSLSQSSQLNESIGNVYSQLPVNDILTTDQLQYQSYYFYPTIQQNSIISQQIPFNQCLSLNQQVVAIDQNQLLLNYLQQNQIGQETYYFNGYVINQNGDQHTY